jgi:ribonuclease R
LTENGEGGRGTIAHSETPSPWSKRGAEKVNVRAHDVGRMGRAHISGHDFSRAAKHNAKRGASAPEVIPIQELHEIAQTSSDAERRADQAERELMEWKKLKFMESRIGEDFAALIVSVTKYGMFVELEELFIEGLVPLQSLTDDRYTYRENTRQIMGERSRKTYSIGDRVRVLLDRIDHVQKKMQFALLDEAPSRAQKRHRRARR